MSIRIKEPGHPPATPQVGLWQLVGQCFSIGPLIDVALFLGIVASVAGATAPLAVLLAAAGMVVFAMVVAFYASETGGAGAIGDYIGRAWGARAGVAVLGLYVLSLLFSGAAGFTIAVGELGSRFFHLYFGQAVPWWAGTGAVVAVAWVLNRCGARAATKVQLGIIALSVIPFVLTAVAVILHAGSSNTWQVFSWNNPHGGDLFGALLFCILLFGGFETAGSLAEETRNPRRYIPLALVGTVAGVALLLVLCSYAGTIFYGPANVAKDWGSAMDGYARMADQLLGSWAGFWIRLAVLVDFTATCIGFSVAAARGICALARSGFLPARWASTNRQGTPRAASDAVFACGLLALAAGFLIPPGQRYESLFVTATAQAVLLVVVYSGLALGAVRIMWQSKSEQPAWRWIIFPAATLAPSLALYGTFVPFPAAPERFGLLAASGAVVAAGLWILWKPKGHAARQ